MTVRSDAIGTPSLWGFLKEFVLVGILPLLLIWWAIWSGAGFLVLLVMVLLLYAWSKDPGRRKTTGTAPRAGHLADIPLADGRIEAIRCRARAVVQVAQVEDEGYHYFFDVGQSTILFIGGRGLPPSDQFPNSDFEILRDPESGALLHKVHYGDRLAPVYEVASAQSREWAVPHGVTFTFPGSIDTLRGDLESFMRSDSSGADFVRS